jgi:hypothetical protein
MTQELIVFTEPMLRANPSQQTYFMAGAGNLTSTSQCSIGIGKTALSSLTSGGHNVAIGFRSMRLATTPGSNVCVGSFAGENAIDVIDSVAVGFGALQTATTGVGAVAVGIYALEKAATAGANTALGDSTLRETTTGELNVAVGYTTMDKNTTGSRNVAVGTVANFARLDGELNAFFGHGAGRYGTTGDNNVGLGFEALANTEADNSVAVGYAALQNATTGNENTTVGYASGQKITTGSGNVFVGSGAGQQTAQKVDAVGSIAVGQNATTTKDNQAVIGTSAITETLLYGKVGVGVADPTANLQAKGTSNTEIPLFERDFAGSPANNGLAALNLRARRTGTMGDGFGVGLRFVGIDDAATERPFGLITAVRRTADDVGEVLVRPQNGSGFAQGLAVRGEMASLMRQTAPVSGGDANSAFTLTSNLIGVYAGTGAPTIAAAKGSLYMRADGSTTNDRMYVNTDGSTGWTAVITAA